MSQALLVKGSINMVMKFSPKGCQPREFSTEIQFSHNYKILIKALT